MVLSNYYYPGIMHFIGQVNEYLRGYVYSIQTRIETTHFDTYIFISNMSYARFV